MQMVEMASEKFVCIVDDSKLVAGLGGSKLAMPVEIVQFCHTYTLRRLQALPEVAGCEAKLRMEGALGCVSRGGGGGACGVAR
jgi:ribose 5-phosphate isomerase A